MYSRFYAVYCSVVGPVWEGSGSTQNESGSGSSGGVASLVELEPFFRKCLAKRLLLLV
jgi:hypothetical protein